MNGDQFLIVNSHLEFLEGVILPHNKQFSGDTISINQGV